MKAQVKNGDHQSVSSGCLRCGAFRALASPLEPIREVSSVASGGHAFHGWQAGPFTHGYCDDDLACGNSYTPMLISSHFRVMDVERCVS